MKKKEHVLRTTKLRGGKKNPPSIFSRRKGRNNNKQKSIHIYYFEAKNKRKLIIMVTCEEREKIEKKQAFLEKYFILWHRLWKQIKLQKKILIETKTRQI